MAVTVVLAVVAVALAAAAGIRWWMRRHGILSFRTMAGRAWVIPSYDAKGEPTRVLRVGGGNQSATYVSDERWTESPSAYIRAFDIVFDAPVPVRDVLVLGGGGFSFPKQLITCHPEARADVVEIDPAVVSLAQRFFFLDRLVVEYDTEATGRLNMIVQDALEFLRESQTTYDAIVNDIFAGRTPAQEFLAPATLELVRAHLAPGGMYAVNVVSPGVGAKSQVLHDTVAACRQAFPHVAVVVCTRDDAQAVSNRIVVASEAPCEQAAEAWSARLCRAGK